MASMVGSARNSLHNSMDGRCLVREVMRDMVCDRKQSFLHKHRSISFTSVSIKTWAFRPEKSVVTNTDTNIIRRLALGVADLQKGPKSVQAAFVARMRSWRSAELETSGENLAPKCLKSYISLPYVSRAPHRAGLAIAIKVLKKTSPKSSPKIKTTPQKNKCKTEKQLPKVLPEIVHWLHFFSQI